MIFLFPSTPVGGIRAGAQLEWEPRERIGGQVIRWSGDHPEGLGLRYMLSYTHDEGRSWRPLSPPTEGTELAMDFDRLPGGDRCMIALTATDGFNTVTVTSQAFDVPLKPCQAMILAPENGTEFPLGEPVILQGQGFYLEENHAELEALEWRSSQDGPLGRGSLLRLEGMSLGAHTITLLAGIEGRIGEATVQIAVHPSQDKHK